MCIRGMESDNRQRGERSSRERVMGPGEMWLLGPSTCPAGVRQRTGHLQRLFLEQMLLGSGGPALKHPSCSIPDAFLPRPGPLAPNMPPPADPAPPRPGKAPPPQPGMLKGGPGSPAVHVL